MNTREFAKMLHGSCPPGRYSLERYGKPWRVVTVTASDTGKPTPAPASQCSSPIPAPAPRVSAPAVVPEAEAVPVVVPVPAPVAEAVPVPAPVETAAAKMARMMAAGRRSVSGSAPAESEPDADSSPYPVPPALFHRAGSDFRRSWVRKNWPDLARLEPEEADAAIQDRLAEILARK